MRNNQSFLWMTDIKRLPQPKLNGAVQAQEEFKAKLFVRSSPEITQSIIPFSLSVLAVI